MSQVEIVSISDFISYQSLIVLILVFDLVMVSGITPDITVILSLVCGILRHLSDNLEY